MLLLLLHLDMVGVENLFIRLVATGDCLAKNQGMCRIIHLSDNYMAELTAALSLWVYHYTIKNNFMKKYFVLAFATFFLSVNCFAQTTRWINMYGALDYSRGYAYEKNRFRPNDYWIDNDYALRKMPVFGLSKQNANGDYTEVNISGWYNRQNQELVFDSATSVVNTKAYCARIQIERCFQMKVSDDPKLHFLLGGGLRFDLQEFSVRQVSSVIPIYDKRDRSGLFKVLVIPHVQYDITKAIKFDCAPSVSIFDLGVESTYFGSPNLTSRQQHQSVLVGNIAFSAQIRAGLLFRIGTKS
jgi:hypothetical protein